MTEQKKDMNFSMKIDLDTLNMLKEIQVYKEFSNTSETVRWLIRRYHKKKIDKIVYTAPRCPACQHCAIRTDPVTGDKIMYCCKCAHDVDKECSSATCGMFEEKED